MVWVNMDHVELGGNFTTKTVECSRTQHGNVHKSKNKIMWKFQQRSYNYNIYLIITGTPWVWPLIYRKWKTCELEEIPTFVSWYFQWNISKIKILSLWIYCQSHIYIPITWTHACLVYPILHSKNLADNLFVTNARTCQDGAMWSLPTKSFSSL